MRLRHILASTLLAITFAASAHALTVTVPDNYTTITAAIASGADIILVKQGEYRETIVISRALELRAADPIFMGAPGAFPQISGTVTLNQAMTTSGGPIIVSGFRITGAVTHTLGYSKSAIIRECRLDQGVNSNGLAVGSLSLRGCIIRGNITLNPEYIEMTCCTVLGGGLVANYEADGNVRHNYIVGPAAVAMNLTTDDGGCPVFENVVIGTTDGIVLTNAGGTSVTYNDVLNVTGDAFKVVRTTGIPNATFQHNLVQNAGGDAFNLTGSMNVSLNTIMSAGGYGVYASSDGGATTMVTISSNTMDSTVAGGIALTGSSAFATDCSSNAVNAAGGIGISLASATTVGYNTVGRSGGAGIVVAAANGTATYRNNTVYLSGGHGLTLGGVTSTSVLNNIAYGNSGYGLRWTSAAAPTIGCNDYFGNSTGPVFGTPAGATDKYVNPLFCDLQHNIVHVAQSSPMVGGACGQIGSRGVACTSPVGVPQLDAGSLRFSVGARPAAGPVTFSCSALPEAGLIEVFDANGARVWTQALARGVTTARWEAGRGGGAPSPGVYFARLHCSGREERQRVVVLK